MYVVDASVHVADARPQDPNHAEARAFLDRVAADGCAVLVPTIVLAEVASAISRGMGYPDVARRVTAVLRRQPHCQFVPVDGLLGDLAAGVAADSQIRGCDAVYVALALQHGAVLITLDREQQTRAPHDVDARTPAQELAALA
jgi:predicted nucleic acid-binding protein